jgi:hypothetical protein
MADKPAKESAVSEPTFRTDETAQAIATLLNNEETARNDEELGTAKSEKEGEVDLVKDNDDPLMEDVDVNEEIVDDNESISEKEEELYDVKINGINHKVNLENLKKGYSLEKDYTRKTMDLSNQRKEVESLQGDLKKELEAVKSSRNQYATQLDHLSKQLQQEEKIDWDTLYRDDPAEYVKKKADSDKRKEALQLAQQEQVRIHQEQRSEQEKVYRDYLAKERQILAEKLPVYADKNKSAEFTKRLTNFAKENGYTDQEIAMMVDHRAVLLLADAYRYNQLKKTKLTGKKVNKPPRIVSSNASNVREESVEKQNLDKRMNKLKKSGHLDDAKDVFKEMFFNK